MSGINLNLQNSYAALYSSSISKTDNPLGGPLPAETASKTTNQGEKLTLSPEAIALSQQAENPEQIEETPQGGGAGIRPPESTPLGGGAGIRPPLTS